MALTLLLVVSLDPVTPAVVLVVELAVLPLFGLSYRRAVPADLAVGRGGRAVGRCRTCSSPSAPARCWSASGRSSSPRARSTARPACSCACSRSRCPASWSSPAPTRPTWPTRWCRTPRRRPASSSVRWPRSGCCRCSPGLGDAAAGPARPRRRRRPQPAGPPAAASPRPCSGCSWWRSGGAPGWPPPWTPAGSTPALPAPIARTSRFGAADGLLIVAAVALGARRDRRQHRGRYLQPAACLSRRCSSRPRRRPRTGGRARPPRPSRRTRRPGRPACPGRCPG